MNELTLSILEVCLIPVLAIFTKYFTDFISGKIEALKIKSKTELERKYLNMIDNTINTCVVAMNQTFVETLKAEDSFDEAAQTHALETTLDMVTDLLSKEVIKYINETFGDAELYLTNKIEQVVNRNKR